MTSLPGLGLDEPDDGDIYGFNGEDGDAGGRGGGGQGESRVVDIGKDMEWRFEVAPGTSGPGGGRGVMVKLVNGTAEISGTELVLNHDYYFLPTKKCAVFTWTGCSVEITADSGSISSTLSSEYIAEETYMNEYVNLAFALDGIRERIAVQGGQGPRVLILGPDNAGKSSLARMLTGYAIRAGRAPLVVNLDPGESILSLPGTVTASVFKTSLEVEDLTGWGTAPMSGPNGEIPVKLPLVYYYGSMDTTEKSGILFKALLKRLALAIQGRMAMQEDVRTSGMILDTPGSLVTGKNASDGYDTVAHIVSEFAISAIVCIGSERIYSDMVRKFDGQPTSGSFKSQGASTAIPELITVVKVPKSGGVVDRDAAFMRVLRDAQVRTYFYGSPRTGAGISLQPRQQQVDFDTLTVWRRISTGGSGLSYSVNNGGAVGTGYDEETFLPGGAGDDSDYMPTMNPLPTSTTTNNNTNVPLPATQIFERLTSPIPALKHCVLAVMNCEPEPESGSEQEVLRDSSVMGFLYVTDMDETRGKISLLSPVAGRVPARALVWGEGIDGVLSVVG